MAPLKGELAAKRSEGLFLGLGCFHHNGTLHPLLKELAAVFIRSVDVAAGVVGVGGAAAGAVQPRPTFPTVGVGYDVASVELFPKLGIRDALPHVAHRVVRQGNSSPQGVTARYSVPEPQPDMRLCRQGPPERSSM